ncbi:uncharacterized protein [Temnothorax nylanderi]|uniref:uncharacterized protein n=1 Tax=Temnothorax nylanderi TaxID=102681 RepID=UPI003A8A0154
MMGRKKASIWRHFVTSEGPSTSSKTSLSCIAVCSYCNLKYSFANATRMIQHIAKDCKQCPESARKETQKAIQKHSSTKRLRIQSDTSDDEDNNLVPLSVPNAAPSFESTLASTPSVSSSSTSKSSRSNKTLEKFVSVTTDKMKTKIDHALARAVFITGVPFSIFENPYWKFAMSLMRPSYEPPSAYQISNPLLNSEYDQVMQSVKAKIKAAPCLGIITDGWTNIRGENLINFVISTPEPIFLKSVAPGKERETAKFISSEILKIIDDLVKDDVDVKRIFLIVTDNAANMRAAWSLVNEKHPHIVTIGCCAHSLNLLVNDMIKQPSVQCINKKVKKVIKEFKNHHVINAVFKSEQKERYGSKAISLKLPPKTRWFYLVISLYSIRSNKAAMQATVIEENLDVKREIRDMVLDNDGFWELISELYKMLIEIAKAISKVESDKTVLSEVPQLTKQISTNVSLAVDTSSIFTGEEKIKVNKAIVERLYNCNSEIHFAANLLDPKKLGKDLELVEKQSAFQFISKQCEFLNLEKGLVLANLAEFRTKTGFFSDSSIWEAAAHVSPATWWGGFCSDQNLYSIAMRLFNVPPSSAACERNWSTHGFVHSKIRNRLTNERVQKQVAIKSNLRFTANALPEKPSKAKNKDFCDSSCNDTSYVPVPIDSTNDIADIGLSFELDCDSLDFMSETESESDSDYSES